MVNPPMLPGVTLFILILLLFLILPKLPSYDSTPKTSNTQTRFAGQAAGKGNNEIKE
jgi:hypothetical protein